MPKTCLVLIDLGGSDMASFNRVILVGNLTRDIDLRYTPSGTAVTEVGMAVNDRVKKNGEWTDETTFVDITLWGRTAEVASEYLSKGSPVLIEGRLKLDSWEQEGQKRSKLRVVGEKMQMLGGRSPGSGPARQSQASGGGYSESVAGESVSGDSGSGNQGSYNAPGGSVSEDEIPF